MSAHVFDIAVKMNFATERMHERDRQENAAKEALRERYKVSRLFSARARILLI